MQGRTKDSAVKLIEDAKDLEDAGVFSIVLEMVSREVAEIISETISIPTIGIGSGACCDGKIKPKFAKRYMSLSEDIVNSLGNYKKDIESGMFPAQENWFSMDEEELRKLREQIGR